MICFRTLKNIKNYNNKKIGRNIKEEIVERMNGNKAICILAWKQKNHNFFSVESMKMQKCKVMIKAPWHSA
jgi:hypothetical protein